MISITYFFVFKKWFGILIIKYKFSPFNLHSIYRNTCESIGEIRIIIA